jgi:hypothetical protein
MQRVLTLALFMFRIFANHAHDTPALDNCALITDFFYRCSDLHDSSLILLITGILPLKTPPRTLYGSGGVKRQVSKKKLISGKPA